MKATEHYREAEKCLELASQTESASVADSWQRDAIVHAILACAGGMALTSYATPSSSDLDEWEQVAGGGS